MTTRMSFSRFTCSVTTSSLWRQRPMKRFSPQMMRSQQSVSTQNVSIVRRQPQTTHPQRQRKRRQLPTTQWLRFPMLPPKPIPQYPKRPQRRTQPIQQLDLPTLHRPQRTTPWSKLRRRSSISTTHTTPLRCQSSRQRGTMPQSPRHFPSPMLHRQD